MLNRNAIGCFIVSVIAVFPGILLSSGDLDDGISEYTEESIAADDTMGNKDTNINFVVVDAIAQAKMAEKKSAENAQDKNDQKETDGKDNTQKKSLANINDGTKENNANSVVVESGSKVDKIYNIVIEK